MELSSLIGKRILSPAGETLGYVRYACLTRDRKKLASLVCADREEEEFYLPSRAVLSVSDALVAGKARLAAPAGVPFPARCPVFTEKGESLGLLADVIFGGDGTDYVAVKDGERTVFPVDRAQEGDTMIVYPTPALKRAGGKKRAVHRAEPVRGEQPTRSEEAVAAGEQRPSAVREAPEAGEEATLEQPVPMAGERLNRVNLLGRRVRQTVTGSDGTPIVRAGECVTLSVLAAARRDNRLLQLTVSTFAQLC